MCLAVPVRVVELGAQETATVDLGGIRKEISLALVDDVAVGDYVILHVGYALTKLDAAEAERTLALFAAAGLSASPLPQDDGSSVGGARLVENGSLPAPEGEAKSPDARPERR